MEDGENFNWHLPRKPWAFKPCTAPTAFMIAKSSFFYTLLSKEKVERRTCCSWTWSKEEIFFFRKTEEKKVFISWIKKEQKRLCVCKYIALQHALH